MRELESLGIWSAEVKDMIVRNKGSVQDISGIPDDIKEKYKIVWEIPMRSLIDMAADRGAFICQSQSMNLWLEDPDYKTLTSMHFHAWSKGLKTGLYYLRRKPKHQPQQFTIVPPSGQVENDQEEGCLMCGA
jgi:ribonucleotide reductase alpha subunit